MLNLSDCYFRNKLILSLIYSLLTLIYLSDSELCQVNPCLNNGTCVQANQTSYTCECAPNFYGKNCEKCKFNSTKKKFIILIYLEKILFKTDINPCASNPCLNNGVCWQPFPNLDVYSCDCPNFYYGSNCQHCENHIFFFDRDLIINSDFTSIGLMLVESVCK